MVTMAIIGALAAMMAAAMAWSMDAARRDKTRALIARLDVLVMQKYESYRYRRLPIQIPDGLNPRVAAQVRCDALRQLMRMEMPERWADIIANPIAINAGGTQVTMYRPAVSQAYLNFYNSISQTPQFMNQIPDPDGGSGNPQPAGNYYVGAKCLYLLVTMGLEDSDVLENFSQADIGDPTNSGCNCFLDAWGKPIEFLRWAPGFQSDLQTGFDRDQTDPLGVYGNPAVPPAAPGPANTYALYPLIYSPGPDGYLDIVYDVGTGNAFDYSKFNNNPFASVTDTADFSNGPIGTKAILSPDPGTGTPGWADNVHNHLIGAH